MNFELIILGTSSAIPLPDRNPSAQILKYNDSKILIDCGEGTQVQLIKYNIKPGNITHVFISHLHVDHYAGLIGLLCTFALQNRTVPLEIYSPPGLKEIIEIQLDTSSVKLSYNLIFNTLTNKSSEIVTSFNNLQVHAIPLKHRISCYGFIFKEIKTSGNIKKESIDELSNLPFEAFNILKAGKNYTDEKGNTYYSNDYTVKFKPRSYAYITDTAYCEQIIPLIKNADLLFHETTFSHELIEKAEKTFHSTTIQAAQIALKASVNQLIIGHFSARYKNVNALLDEAKSVFGNTDLAIEGRIFKIGGKNGEYEVGSRISGQW